MQEFTILHMFCGLGGAALGFQQAAGEFRGVVAKFRTIAGIDCDPEACQDFEMLTGAPAVQMDLFSREDYVAFHGSEPPAGWQEVTAEDIRRICGYKTPDTVFFSAPCLPGYEKVLAIDGPRRIDAIRHGDMVLTHRGRYRQVNKVGTELYQGNMVEIRLNGDVDFRDLTADHPIWRRKVIRCKATNRKRALGKPEFVAANKIKVGDRIGFPVINESPGCARKFVESFGDPQVVQKNGEKNASHTARISKIIDLNPYAEDIDLWFLIGAYLGDGYRRHDRYGTNFCIGDSKSDLAVRIRSILQHLGLNWNEDASNGENNIKIRLDSRHLSMIMGAFGDGAENKNIPWSLMELETPLIKALFDGYMATDGSIQPRCQANNELQARWKLPSVSLQLLKSLQILMLRLGLYGGINNCWPGGKQTIMGRDVQTKQRWELAFRFDPKKRPVHEFIDGAIWVRVKEIKSYQTIAQVWNLEVDEDNTFCVPMMATHNCKGFSGLLPKKAAESPKYQALNKLAYRGLSLVVEAFEDDPPAVLLFENVPKITSRGKALLDQIKKMLGAHGYEFDENSYDCGEIGGLGQHRTRYLLIARNKEKMPNHIYLPPKRRVKSIGEIIGPLALPGDPSLGPMHRLPNLQWKTWVRLALIPAGGDWRDLEKIGDSFKNSYRIVPWDEAAGTVTSGHSPSNGATSVADPRLGHEPRAGVFQVADWNEPSKAVVGHARTGGSNGVAAVSDPRVSGQTFSNCHQVQAWDEPSYVVTGATRPIAGSLSVSDPRLNPRDGRYPSVYQVIKFDDPAPCVTGTRFGSGAPGVADPRLPQVKTRFHNKYQLCAFDEPAACVTGIADVQAGAPSIADPRIGCNSRPNLMGVADWGKPAKTVTGSVTVSSSNGVATVADPRYNLNPNAMPNILQVGQWDTPAKVVTGAAGPTNGAPSVADPRKRNGIYGVMDWDKSGVTVCGAADIHSGTNAIADPRVPADNETGAYLIIALDGTWHRPLTTLELAVLQGMEPTMPDGSPLVLAGKSDSRHRERIGNAVPVASARAMGEEILTALLVASMDEWTLGSTGVWVIKNPNSPEWIEVR